MANLKDLIVNGVARFVGKVYSSGGFVGDLEGTASNASKVNNLTVQTAVPANAKFTDTNTWRGIQDNLTSDSTTDSLSAKQGKLLNDTKQDKNTPIQITDSSLESRLYMSSNIIDLWDEKNGNVASIRPDKIYLGKKRGDMIVVSAQIIDDSSESGVSSLLRVSDILAETIRDYNGNTLSGKQNKLTAGENITINGNVISAAACFDVIGEKFDNKISYKKDDYCISHNNLYRCLIACTGVEPPNASHWEQTNISVEIGNVISATGEYISNKMDKENPTGTGSFSLNRKVYTTIGDYSFAEGDDTTASGYASHSEGDNTTASGYGSHAEGYVTTASGTFSHAEGYDTAANGNYSHAEGGGTIASGYYQHVQGKYNIADATSAFIIGNGAGTLDRSNALKLDWNGNLNIAGSLTGGVSSIAPQYSAIVSYKINDYCYFSGKLYKCILQCTGTTPPDTTYWEEITVMTAINSAILGAIGGSY